jgi:hypothetical protein
MSKRISTETRSLFGASKRKDMPKLFIVHGTIR